MAPPTVADGLTQRLVVQRLAQPGMLDRRQLEHARFATAPVAPVSGRLLRRAEFGTPDSRPLLLARGEFMAGDPAWQPAAAVSSRAVSTATSSAFTQGDARVAGESGTAPAITSAFSAAPVIARTIDGAALASPAAPPQSMNASRQPSPADRAPRDAVILRGPTSVAAADPGLAVDDAPSAVVTVAASRPAPISPAGRIQRQADIGYPATPHRPEAAPSLVPAPGAAPDYLPAAPASAPRAARALTVTGPQRQAVPPLVRAVVQRAPVAGGSLAARPLLMRKAAQLPRVPGIAFASRIAAAAGASAMASHAATPPASWRAAPDAMPVPVSLPPIERIADEVESRLARRLEIERERRGVPTWRRES